MFSVSNIQIRVSNSQCNTISGLTSQHAYTVLLSSFHAYSSRPTKTRPIRALHLAPTQEVGALKLLSTVTPNKAISTKGKRRQKGGPFSYYQKYCRELKIWSRRRKMCRLSADRLQRAMYPSYQILCVAGCSEAYLTSMSY